MFENILLHCMKMHYVMQKKDRDIEELLKKNAALEEAVKQMRQNMEAGADKTQVKQVGVIPLRQFHANLLHVAC